MNSAYSSGVSLKSRVVSHLNTHQDNRSEHEESRHSSLDRNFQSQEKTKKFMGSTLFQRREQAYGLDTERSSKRQLKSSNSSIRRIHNEIMQHQSGLRKINVIREIQKSNRQRGDAFLATYHSQLHSARRDKDLPFTTKVEPTIEVRQRRLRKKSRRVSSSIQTT